MDGVTETAALAAAWRRLDQPITTIRGLAHEPGNETEIGDAATDALDKIYRLWEHLWRSRSVRSHAKQDLELAQDSGGQLVAALMFARGSVTHELIEFIPEFTGFGYGSGVYGVGRFGVDGYCWRSHTGSGGMQQRSDWYAEHVAWFTIVATLDAASEWLGQQTETRRPD